MLKSLHESTKFILKWFLNSVKFTQIGDKKLPLNIHSTSINEICDEVYGINSSNDAENGTTAKLDPLL